MGRRQEFYLGKVLYGEWMIPIVHYYKVIKKNELMFELILPIIIAFNTVYIYQQYSDLKIAIDKLEDMLPNVLAILIGFTISCIAMLISCDTEKITALNKLCEERHIKKKGITLQRLLLINFSYALIIQVFFLINIFFIGFVLSFTTKSILFFLIIVWEIFLLLHILFLLIRMITNLYCIYTTKE